MKNLLTIILATLVVLALVIGCSKDEPEASPVVSTPQTTTSTPAAAVTTPSHPSPTPTTTASVPEKPATSPTTEPSPDPGSGEAEEIPVYSWEEAADHIGETATIIGPVFDVKEITMPNGTVGLVLGVGGPVDFGAFLVGLNVDRESLPEDMYVGHTISVTGYIVTGLVSPSGVKYARITIDELAQIEIIE